MVTADFYPRLSTIEGINTVHYGALHLTFEVGDYDQLNGLFFVDTGILQRAFGSETCLSFIIENTPNYNYFWQAVPGFDFSPFSATTTLANGGFPQSIVAMGPPPAASLTQPSGGAYLSAVDLSASGTEVVLPVRVVVI